MEMFDKIFCFIKSTEVCLPNGKKKPIESIRLGDRIISYNINRNILSSVIVTNVVQSRHSIINKITFSNGYSLMSTLDHPYWVTNKGWCSVDYLSSVQNFGIVVEELKTNDICLCLDNGIVRHVNIVNIETHLGDFEMFDISGGDDHCFFANSILVHDENIESFQLFNLRRSVSLAIQ